MEQIDSDKSIYKNVKNQLQQSKDSNVLSENQAPVTQKLCYFDSKAQAGKFQIETESVINIDR